MIELTLIEDKIFYGVVEEFLFTKKIKNSNYKDKSVFDANSLIRFSGNSLTEVLRWIGASKQQELLPPFSIIKYQQTDITKYKKIIRSYTNEEVKKYLLLI
jgi:hypothetical protein